MKAFIKILPFLFILLLCGWRQLPAHACTQSDSSLAFSKLSTEPVSQNTYLVITPASPEKNINHKIDLVETEIEEEEFSTSRKPLEDSLFFIAIFCPFTFGYLIHFLKKRFSFTIWFSYLTSYRAYIQLRMIRI
jgi:hypothetical protein